MPVLALNSGRMCLNKPESSVVVKHYDFTGHPASFGDIVSGAKARGIKLGNHCRLALNQARNDLADGPQHMTGAASFADISERTLIAAASALGVRTRKGQWWIPDRRP